MNQSADVAILDMLYKSNDRYAEVLKSGCCNLVPITIITSRGSVWPMQEMRWVDKDTVANLKANCNSIQSNDDTKYIIPEDFNEYSDIQEVLDNYDYPRVEEVTIKENDPYTDFQNEYNDPSIDEQSFYDIYRTTNNEWIYDKENGWQKNPALY